MANIFWMKRDIDNRARALESTEGLLYCPDISRTLVHKGALAQGSWGLPSSVPSGVTLLWILTSVSAPADRPASYGNQTISSTRPSCYIHLSTVGVINIAADHQMFRTLTGELSWQRLRPSPFDLYSKSEKNRSLSHPLGHLGVTYHSIYGSLESPWSTLYSS